MICRGTVEEKILALQVRTTAAIHAATHAAVHPLWFLPRFMLLTRYTTYIYQVKKMGLIQQSLSEDDGDGKRARLEAVKDLFKQ